MQYCRLSLKATQGHTTIFWTVVVGYCYCTLYICTLLRTVLNCTIRKSIKTLLSKMHLFCILLTQYNCYCCKCALLYSRYNLILYTKSVIINLQSIHSRAPTFHVIFLNKEMHNYVSCSVVYVHLQMSPFVIPATTPFPFDTHKLRTL